MPRGLTARTFLRIYSLRHLVSAAPKRTHTHPPPFPFKSCLQPNITFARSTLLFPASLQAAGQPVPKDQLDPGGSKWVLPGIPFCTARGSTEDGQGPGSSPKRSADAKARRHVGSHPRREKWGPDQDAESAPAF